MFGLNLDYRSFTHELIERFLQLPETAVMLVPHTIGAPGNVNNDRDASAHILESLRPEQRQRVFLLEGDYNQHELKGVIGTCDFFIGSRMHACIAALSQNVPTAAVAYSSKFQGVFQSVGMQHSVIDARTSTTDAALAQVFEIFRNRGKEKATLELETQKVRQNILKILGASLHRNPA